MVGKFFAIFLKIRESQKKKPRDEARGFRFSSVARLPAREDRPGELVVQAGANDVHLQIDIGRQERCGSLRHERTWNVEYLARAHRGLSRCLVRDQGGT